MSEIRIKTKVLKEAGFEKINLKDQMPVFTYDSEKMNQDVKRIRYAMGTKEQVETVGRGDLAVLSVISELPLYQRDDISVIVGRNLYSRELEEKLVGLPLGKSEITVEDTAVTVDISSITRTVIPELTDENVKGWGLDGVSTVAELRRYFFDRQVDQFRDYDDEADMFTSVFSMQAMEACEFEIDEDELKASKEALERQMAKPIDMEDLEAEEEDSSYDTEEIINMMAVHSLKGAALGYVMRKREGNLLTMEDYEKALEQRTAALSMSKEEASEIFTPFHYAVEEYADDYFSRLDFHVGKGMKEYYFKTSYKPDIYDVAIIGAGPAGLSAALTLNLHNKSILWFGTDSLSDKVEKSEKIANYAGFLPGSGSALNEAFRAQIKDADLVLTDKMVTQISNFRNEFMVLADNEIYKARTVLLTIGAVPPKGIGNELELLGRGVSYCATCDGFLYKGKTIAVYCGTKRYEHEVAYLAEMAEKVYLYASYDDVEIDLPNVERLPKPMKRALGEAKISAIELTDGSIIEVDGAFFLRSAVAPSTILRGLEMDGAHIVVNRGCETNIPGCYAAGDCIGRPYQIAKAVGEGNIAAHGIVEYLAKE